MSTPKSLTTFSVSSTDPSLITSKSPISSTFAFLSFPINDLIFWPSL